MSGKSISIPLSRRQKPDIENALDAFVQGSPETPVPLVKDAVPSKRPMKRLTFDIAADLHKRIRMTCLERDKDMAEEIRRILNEQFPA